jgi:hypothetical protein
MDVISTQAIIQKLTFLPNSNRIINHHLQWHFGRSLFASEAEHRKYFDGSKFPPHC